MVKSISRLENYSIKRNIESSRIRFKKSDKHSNITERIKT